MRILLQHPYVKINYLTADRSAGMSFAEVYPQFSHVKVRWGLLNECDSTRSTAWLVVQD